MKNVITVILCLLTSLNKANEAPAHFDYYSHTRKAEGHIIASNFRKAKLQYDALLRKSASIFAWDMHNAVRCCILIKDYESAVIWCERLALKGVGIKYFDASVFGELKHSIHWAGFLKKYPSLEARFRAGLDHDLIREIDRLVAQDQEIYVANSIKRVGRPALKRTTDSVTKKLIKLIKARGFPSEEKYGIQMLQDTMIRRNPDYQVLIAHAHQVKANQLGELKRAMRKAASVYDYDINRSNLAHLLKQPCLQIYKGKLFNSKGCPFDQDEVDKIVFKFNNPYRFYTEVNFVTVAHDKPDEDETQWNRHFDFVVKLTDDLDFFEKSF